MLTLPGPKDLKVKADVTEEEHLLDISRKWLEKEERTPGIHVSSILDPLYAYWETKNPHKLLPREVTTFLVGKILHAFLISAAEGVKGVDWASDLGSKHSKEFDIEYSIDYSREGNPTEIKTSRSYFEPKDIKDIAMYLEQLLCYMVIEGKRKGKLWVLYLNLKDKDGRTCPMFRCYHVEITKKGFDDYEAEIRQAHKQLTVALKKKSPKGLPLCREWKCKPNMCPHWSLCKPEGRFDNPQYLKGKK